MSSRWPVRPAAPLLLAALLVGGGQAHADDTPDTQRQADERFQEGKALLAQGEIAAACQKLEQSLALLRRGGTLLNLAVCREKEGRHATAMRLYQEALQVAIADRRADRETLARERLAEVRPKVSWIEVKPAEGAAIAGLAITCDDQPIPAESWGTPMPFDTGPHRVVASAPGHTPFEIAIALATPGERKTVSVPALVRIEPPAPPPTAAPTPSATATAAPSVTSTAAGKPPPSATPDEPPPPTWRRPAGIAALAAGLSATVVGAAFGIKAIVDNDATLRLCPNNRCPDDEGLERNQDARTAALVADIALPVGLVAAGAGVLLLVTSRPPGKPAPRPGGSVARISVIPGLGPGGGALWLRGAW